MERIKSVQEIERKRKRNSTIVSLIFLALLVFSTLGYSFLSRPNNSDNGTNNNAIPNTYDFNGQSLTFSNSKEETSEVSLEFNRSLNEVLTGNLYIATDNENIYYEIASTLGRFSSRLQKACYGPCEENLPEKNCTDNLIVWRDNSLNKVTQEQNCIFIDGDLRTVDAFLYKIFGL